MEIWLDSDDNLVWKKRKLEVDSICRHTSLAYLGKRGLTLERDAGDHRDSIPSESRSQETMAVSGCGMSSPTKKRSSRVTKFKVVSDVDSGSLNS